jgi:hypothetical protein
MTCSRVLTCRNAIASSIMTALHVGKVHRVEQWHLVTARTAYLPLLSSWLATPPPWFPVAPKTVTTGRAAMAVISDVASEECKVQGAIGCRGAVANWGKVEVIPGDGCSCSDKHVVNGSCIIMWIGLITHDRDLQVQLGSRRAASRKQHRAGLCKSFASSPRHWKGSPADIGL